eukprot:s247_g4.t1
MFWSTLAYTSITAGEVTKAFQQYQATKRKDVWSERECERALRDVRLTMINTVREELRDQVSVVSSSLQSMMVQTSLVLIVGFGSVCEGTFPDAEVGATDYPGLEQFFLEVYAFFAGLTLILPLGSLLLTFAISRELEFFVAASFADLKTHVRRALRRTWPDQSLPSKSPRPYSDPSPALSAREEHARGLEEQRDNDALRAVLEDTRQGPASREVMSAEAEDVEKQPLLAEEKQAEEDEMQETPGFCYPSYYKDSMRFLCLSKVLTAFVEAATRKLITFDVLRAATGTIWAVAAARAESLIAFRRASGRVRASLWQKFARRLMRLIPSLLLVTAFGRGRLLQGIPLEDDGYAAARFLGHGRGGICLGWLAGKAGNFQVQQAHYILETCPFEMKAIVGLLLGFFLSSSVNRWYACTCGFLELFTAIRGLHMQLAAMGAPKEHIHMVVRYAVVSACSLQFSLQMQTLPSEERKAFKEKKWASLLHEGSLDSVKLTSATAVLDEVEDPSQTLWVWVTSLLTNMSANGELPPIPSPTYGKILSWADKAYNGIREVQAAVCVQPPYVYVQMMAILVNVNNLMIAISFGMTLGVTISLAKRGLHAATPEDLQDVAIAFLISTIGPFLYHALLEVAVAVHGLAQDLLRQVQYFNKLYPLAYILLLLGLVSAVCECMVLLSLIFLHHFPSMPVLWQVTVGVGASLALAVFLLSLWTSSSPRVEKEEEVSDAALSPARRRSSKQKPHWLRQQERALEHLREPLLR